MNLSCLFGHKWAGCSCSVCGKGRDQGHDWGKNCEKCARCGATRAAAHNWTGCKCSGCGRTRDEGHNWSRDSEKCSTCGKMRVCLRCGHPKSYHVQRGCDHIDPVSRNRDGSTTMKVCDCTGFEANEQTLKNMK